MPRGNGTTRQVPVKELVRDPRLQSRAGGLNEDHAADMADWLKDRSVTPRKVEVRKVAVEGGDDILYVVDGFHTCEGAERAGRKTVPCNILSGAWEDALDDAAAANQQHKGLKRSRADKAKAVKMMTALHPNWSARRIADHVGVSHTFVNDLLTPKGGNVSTPAKPVSGRKIVSGEQVAEKTGDWRDVPVGDFLKIAGYVQTALDAENINTAGDLDVKLSLLNLTAGVKADLRGELEALKEANGELSASGEIGPQTRSQSEKPAPPRPFNSNQDIHVTDPTTAAPIQGAEKFNWRDAEAAFAVVAKIPDRLRAAYPEKVFENEHAGALRLGNEFAEIMKRWKTRIQESEGAK